MGVLQSRISCGPSSYTEVLHQQSLLPLLPQPHIAFMGFPLSQWRYRLHSTILCNDSLQNEYSTTSSSSYHTSPKMHIRNNFIWHPSSQCLPPYGIRHQCSSNLLFQSAPILRFPSLHSTDLPATMLTRRVPRNPHPKHRTSTNPRARLQLHCRRPAHAILARQPNPHLQRDAPQRTRRHPPTPSTHLAPIAISQRHKSKDHEKLVYESHHSTRKIHGQ